MKKLLCELIIALRKKKIQTHTVNTLCTEIFHEHGLNTCLT